VVSGVTPEEYTAHIEDLARWLGCEYRWVYGGEGMMYVEFGYVEGPPIAEVVPYKYGKNLTAQQAYYIALHELGHYAYGHTQGRPPKSDETHYFDNGVIKSEAEAWEWAMNEAHEEMHDTTRRWAVTDCINTYRDHARYAFKFKTPSRLHNGNRHYVEFLFDNPDTEYVIGVVERMKGVLVPV
jgi:hypothetical protein